MARMTRVGIGVIWTVGTAVLAAMGCVALALVLVSQVAAFMLVAAAGGAVLAGLLLMSRPADAPLNVHDPFAHDLYFTDPINVAHVRVAGVGGLGLVAGALVVALQYPLLSVALLLGLSGGAITAGTLIRWRRHHADVPITLAG